MNPQEHAGNFTFTVHPLQADFQGKFSVIRLCEIILESASQHAASLGFGFQEMHSAGTAWVLTRLAIGVEQYANVYDELRIETWVDSVKSSFSTRKFNVFKSGEIIASASSVWMLIDVKSRRPAPIDVELFKNIVESSKESFAPMPEKVEAIAPTGDVFKRKAVYSDIDVQNHVHSGKYLEWILDTFLKEHFAEKRLREVHLNFLAEACFGDDLLIFKKELNRKEQIFEIINAENMPVCRARLVWL